jgi:hypothetical protein
MRKDTHYIPILKGRLGEYNALKRMKPDVASSYTPLLELIPTGESLSEQGDPDPAGIRLSIQKAIVRLDSYWPVSEDLIVDAHLIPEVPDLYPIAEIVRHFGLLGNQVIPAVRPSDSDESLGALASTLRTITQNSVCIRLSDEDLDDSDMPIEAGLLRVLSKLDVTPETVDLVLDFGPLRDEQAASFAARIARLIIGELPHQASWRSITLAGGGFPAALDTVAPRVLTDLPRWEVTMWTTVRDRMKDKGRLPSFGDYAIAYPVQPNGVGFAPAPQIRYTTAESWLVLKGKKTERRSSAQFFDICGIIAGYAGFTRELSWGDEEIASKAEWANVDPVPPSAKPGNAMMWRAIGTSHHISFVIDQLARPGGL